MIVVPCLNPTNLGSVQVPPFRVQVESISYSYDTAKITVCLRVPDRDDPGREVSINFNTECPAPAWDNEMLRPELVRQLLRQAFNHEIDENLYVDGSRMYDPHILQKFDIRINEASE